jgi:hypothetical protein
VIDSIFGDIFVNQEAERKLKNIQQFVYQNMAYAKENKSDKATFRNRCAAGFIHIYNYIIREQRLPRLYK